MEQEIKQTEKMRQIELGYYAIYNKKNNTLYKSRFKRHLGENLEIIEITENVYENLKAYNYIDGELVFNEDYAKEKEEIEKQKEKERIASLTITKRVFALALRDNFNIPYNELKREIAQNVDAQLEWELCVELHRNNPLLDIMAAKMGITPQQLDYIFRAANGEDVTLQVVNEEENYTNDIVLSTETTEI